MVCAGLERKKALVVFETVWKVRRSVGKVGKRMWSVYMFMRGVEYLEDVRCAAASRWCCSRSRGGGELEL
jgi:hypothetical protein